MYLKFFLISIFGALTSYLLVGYVKTISLRYSILAKPKSDRWHDKPIPIHGSFGFYTVFLFFVLFTVSIYSPDIDAIKEGSGNLINSEILKQITFVIALIGSSLIFFIFGFIDDLFDLKALTRLLMQVLICSLFIIDTNMFAISENQLVNFLFTLLWFIGIINATNLIDSFDGIAAGSIITILLIFLSLILNTEGAENLFYLLAIISIFLGVLFGYFIHNYPPATIFMGDSGSLTIGFIIAAITIPSETNNFLGLDSTNILGIILYPCLLLAFPIFDTSLVTISRTISGRKFYQGGKDHTAHRLSKLGLSDRVILFICLFYIMIGGLLLFSSIHFNFSIIISALSLLLISIFLLLFLLRIDPYSK